jgi:hypothetical protein
MRDQIGTVWVVQQLEALHTSSKHLTTISDGKSYLLIGAYVWCEVMIIKINQEVTNC